jgi:hypothetical protein
VHDGGCESSIKGLARRLALTPVSLLPLAVLRHSAGTQDIDAMLESALGASGGINVPGLGTLDVKVSVGCGPLDFRSAEASYTHNGRLVAERHVTIPLPRGCRLWRANGISLRVLPEFRGKGVAAALQGRLFSMLTEAGVDEYEVHAEDDGRRRWLLDYDWDLGAGHRGHCAGALWKAFVRLPLTYPAAAPGILEALNHRVLNTFEPPLSIRGTQLKCHGWLGKKNSIGISRAVILLLLAVPPSELETAAGGAGANFTSLLGDWRGVRYLSRRSKLVREARRVAALRLLF